MDRKTPKQVNADYVRLYKKLKPYVSFRIDTRKRMASANRRLVTRYSQQLAIYTRGPNKRYRSRVPGNVAFVQTQCGMSPGFPGFSCAIVPLSSPDGKASVRIKGSGSAKRLVVLDSNIIRETYLFADYESYELQALTDPDTVARNIVKAAGSETHDFVMMCGVHDYSLTTIPGQLANELRYFFDTYSNASEWFHGVIGFRFTDQADFKEYRSAREKSKSKRARKAAKLRRDARERTKEDLA